MNNMRAIRTGAFYASCGPAIHDFRVESGTIRVRCSPVSEIHVISTPAMGIARHAGRGRIITSFVTTALKDWWGNSLPFVRVRVTDARGRMAWTNPIYLRRGRRVAR